MTLLLTVKFLIAGLDKKMTEMAKKSFCKARVHKVHNSHQIKIIKLCLPLITLTNMVCIEGWRLRISTSVKLRVK